MNKFDIYKMIKENKLDEAYKATCTLYFIEKTIPEETYDKLMDAIWEAREVKEDK